MTFSGRNPPEASHQGGIWERMIRSVRKILAALVKEQLMNDEALTTLLCEVEKILNDRPLTPLSDHPDDHEPLTPNKLLLLKSNPSFPLMSSQNTTSMVSAGAKRSVWRIHFGKDGLKSSTCSSNETKMGLPSSKFRRW